MNPYLPIKRIVLRYALPLVLLLTCCPEASAARKRPRKQAKNAREAVAPDTVYIIKYLPTPTRPPDRGEPKRRPRL